MAFELDFNSASAEQRVESLINKLKTLSQEATKASASLTPPPQAAEQIKAVGKASESTTQAMKKATQSTKENTSQVAEASAKASTSAEKFVNSLEKSITKSAHLINAHSGEYGEAVQDMMRSDAQLKIKANEFMNAEKTAHAARLAQAKQTNTILTGEERQSALNRTKNWTEYYQKQDAQIKRYNTSFQKSKEIWANADITRQRRLAQEMSRLANQTMREEIASLNQRSAAWSSYYQKQEAQINRYRAALTQSRATVARVTADKAKAMHSTVSSINLANQAAAGFRATLAGMGMGFGIYTGSTIAFAASMYTLARGMQHTLKVGSEFEKSMYRVYAVTSQMGTTYQKNGNLYVETSERITRSQNQLRDAAVEASKVTVFTGVQAAEGMVALGMAGLKANAVIGALTPSLQLAQIGMIDVYESADIMTNVMLGFGMSVETTSEALQNATHVTDVLASAITNSNSTIREMSRALSYVAPIASAAGGSIEETVAILETFHNVGIKGQRAGTAMRRAYVNLMEPTEKVSERLRDLGISTRDASGNMLSMIDIMTSLKEAGADAGDMVSIFGVRAAPAMIALLANLSATSDEVNRLKNESQGAGKAMADFMATSTSEQWRIINSKIQAQFIGAFQEAEPAIKKLNYELMTLVENDLDSFFGFIGGSLQQMTSGITSVISALRELNEFGASSKEANRWYSVFLPDENYISAAHALLNKAGRTKDLMDEVFAKRQDQSRNKASIDQFPETLKTLGVGLPAFSFLDTMASSASGLNKELTTGVMLTEEMAEELARAANSDAISRLAKFAQLEAEILKDSSFSYTASSARREASVSNEVTKYQEKLGLITKEQSLAAQIAELEKAKATITERYTKETEKNNAALERVRASNQGIAADAAAYETILKSQSQLNDQHKGQQEQINAELVKTKLILQEGLMEDNGYRKLTDEVTKFKESLITTSEKLKGNTEITDENTFATLENSVAKRMAWQASSEFLDLTEDQRAAFELETAAMMEQLPALKALIEANRKLREEKKASDDFDKIAKDFGRGKGLDSESKAIMEYKTSLDLYETYLANKDELMRQYGLSEMEFHNMIETSKSEASQKLWDANHEHLAKWRDDWSKTMADQLESYIFQEQSWKETISNMSRHMLGTMLNTFIRVGAEMAANHLMKMMFTKQEMVADSTVAANKVAAETTKQAAVGATAAVEQMSATAGIAYFTQMLGIGPSLAAAWAPAAMYINIASFGVAGVAASASMALAGAVTGAAGVDAATRVSGARQFGGDVVKGNSYLVGETGREIFTPDTSGRIISNQDLYNSPSGGGSVYIKIENSYHVDATGNEDVEERISRGLEEAGERGHQKVVEDLNNGGIVAKLMQRGR